MHLCIKRLVPEAQLPTRGHASDAGLDMYAVGQYLIRPDERVSVRTGIAMAIPEGYVGLVWDKSGRALKEGLKTMGGVIDAGYRGEVQIIVSNLGHQDIFIEAGQKVAQVLIQKVELLFVEEVENLEDTSRGKHGFGSTGL